VTKADKYVMSVLDGCTPTTATERAGYSGKAPGRAVRRAAMALEFRPVDSDALRGAIDGEISELEEELESVVERMKALGRMRQAQRDVDAWRSSRQVAEDQTGH